MKMLLAAFSLLAALPVAAETAAPYAGQEARAVSSFSDADLSELRKGGGWGLARPAELNGYPGPRHLLDLAPEIGLSEAVIRDLTVLFDAMNAKARVLGAQLIDDEAAVDALFISGTATPEALHAALTQAEATRAALREVHLAAHLQATPLLTRHQRMRYAALRGYGEPGAGTHKH